MTTTRGTLRLVERWLPVPGYAGVYEVSNHGSVRSWKFVAIHGRPLVLNPRSIGSAGYRRVTLRGARKQETRTVHGLVAEAFLGPRAKGMVTRHLNGDKTDNRLANLRWGTPSENNYDAVRHGDNPNAAKTHCPQGHPYDDANTAIRRPVGRAPYRKCRSCDAASHRRRRTAKQEVAA